MIQLLTAPQVFAAPAQSHRFIVELASIEVELDSQGVPVAAYIKKVDVFVAEPHIDDITTLLAAKGHLDGFQVVSHCIPADGCDCF